MYRGHPARWGVGILPAPQMRTIVRAIVRAIARAIVRAILRAFTASGTLPGQRAGRPRYVRGPVRHAVRPFYGCSIIVSPDRD